LKSTKDNIKKVYIEPTSRCNLNCKMCPRNVWTGEILGDMDLTLFNSLIDQVHKIKSIHTIFFGGIAEPLSHPDIAAMIRKAKVPAVTVEMISNGSMLNEEIIEKLLLAGLDTLWISIDSAHHDSQEDLAGLDGFKKAKANLLAFNLLRRKINPAAKLGIAFVAMKSNIADLPEIIDLAAVFGVSELKISNVIPYIKDMQEEMLYRKSLSFGNIKNAKLSTIWQSEAYKTFRSNINNFDFSPCTTCGACTFVDDNMEDCFGNLFPTCGGCLWAEGFAQCP